MLMLLLLGLGGGKKMVRVTSFLFNFVYKNSIFPVKYYFLFQKIEGNYYKENINNQRYQSVSSKPLTHSCYINHVYHNRQVS